MVVRGRVDFPSHVQYASGVFGGSGPMYSHDGGGGPVDEMGAVGSIVVMFVEFLMGMSVDHVTASQISSPPKVMLP